MLELRIWGVKSWLHVDMLITGRSRFDGRSLTYEHSGFGTNTNQKAKTSKKTFSTKP